MMDPVGEKHESKKLAKECNTLFGQSDHICLWLDAGSVCDYMVHYIRNPIWCNDDDINYLRYSACLFLAPFAGVWADRYDRKMLIILADSLIAVATLVIAILFLIGYDSIWLLFVVSAVRALGAGIQMPAISAFLPQIVPEDKLTKVNATYSSLQSLVTLASPMLSGALLTIATLEAIFFIDVITASIAVSILFLFLHVPVHAKAAAKQQISYFGDMSAGLTYVNNHGFIKTLFVFDAVFLILIAPLSFLTPLQVARSFGNDVWRLTVIEVAYSLGMVLGGVVMASWGGFKNKIHTMVFAGLAIGLFTFALGIVPFSGFTSL